MRSIALVGIGVISLAGSASATSVDARSVGGWGASIVDLEQAKKGQIVGLMGSPTLDGSSFFNVLRFDRKASFDTSFGNEGFANPFEKREGISQGMTIAPDGRIAAVGYRQRGADLRSPLVAMMNQDGSLDQTFARGGRIASLLERRDNEVYRDAAFQYHSNGRLIVVGTRNESTVKKQSGLVRAYSRDGSIDRQFGRKGTLSLAPSERKDDTGFDSVLALASGKILVGGFLNGTATVARLDQDGRIDRSFGRRGYAQMKTQKGNYCFSRCQTNTSLALGTSGQITLGTADDGNEVTIGRFNRNGSPLRSFGREGVARYSREALGRLYPEVKHFSEKPRLVSVNGIDVFPDGQVAIALSAIQAGGGKFYGFVQPQSATLLLRKSGRPAPGFGPGGAQIGEMDESADSVLARGNKVLTGGSVWRTLESGDYMPVLGLTGFSR